MTEDRTTLAMHIKTALTTRSGAVLRQWLKENCFMTEASRMEFIDSPGAQQRLNARRDLYIELDNLLQEGIENVTDA